MRKVVCDLTSLAQHGARRLFKPGESFEIVVAGGLLTPARWCWDRCGRGCRRSFRRRAAQAGRGKLGPGAGEDDDP